MSSVNDAVFNAAMALSPNERAVLAERLLESIEHPDQRDIHAAWAEEIAQRVRDIDEGKIETIPAEEVLRGLRAKRHA